MSARASLSALPESVVSLIDGGQANVVATIDSEGRPVTTLMTWAIAKGPDRLALCVDKRSRAFQNLSERPAIAIEILADNVTYGVSGSARVVKDPMDSPPFPCALVIVDIEEARDHGHAGTTFLGPSYFFHDDKQHRSEAEQHVYDELRAFP